ncbi:MAG: hypothetical protein J5I47_06985 [Vicingus serpentipes]|nr:hypothetical protein [Vicingus serpentipes]
MQGLARRFLFYFIGFGLGCVLVWAMFYRNADRPAWMPEGRVLEFLDETEVAINDKAKCQMECYSISTDFMNAAFWEAAKVNFKESAVERQPCPEYKITSGNILIFIEACESEKTATLRNVSVIGKEEQVCGCE